VLLNVASNPNTTSTTLASSLNPAVYGQRVTFTAKVTSNNGPTPTGRVIFMSSGQSIGAAPLNARGGATLSRSNLNASTYSITATYLGDANNIRSQSTILNEVINPTTSTATLTSSPNPSSSGQAVTFTAKITSPTIIPTGSVSLQVGKTVLGTAQLSAGKAVFTTSSLPLGTSVVTVIYERNPNIKGSWASVRQTVQ
jgi:Bacterial Ig-like domain (group 3)